jgi:WD40 repeat protein
MCGLLAAAVAVAGVAGDRAWQGAPRTRGAAGAVGPMASVAPGPGSQMWVARYHGHDHGSSVAISPDGDTVFVTGGSIIPTSVNDYVTVAYNAATGAQEWAARYHGPSNGNSLASSVAVSPAGQTVFVTGSSRGTTSGFDYATVVYNAATGAQEWVARYHGPGNGTDIAFSVAVSPAGAAVFVTGSSRGTTSGYDNATVAYNAATGAQEWVARYHGPSNGVANYSPSSVAVSPSGGTVFILTSGDTKATWAYDYATVAYNAATGAQEWVARYHGPSNGVANYSPSSVAVSPTGETVFVTGGSPGATSAKGYATVAYNATTGAQEWVARYHGPGNGGSSASSVAVSRSGKTVFVTGGSAQSTSAIDYATVAYNAATGDQEWAARYHGPVTHYNQGSRYQGPAYNAGNSVAVSPSGRTVFVTGGDAGTTPAFDYATVAYNATTGAQEWAARYSAATGGGAEALAVSPDGRTVFVFGGNYITVAYHG